MSVGVREMAKNSVANTSSLAERLCQNSTAHQTSRFFAPIISEHRFSRNGVLVVGASALRLALRIRLGQVRKPEGAAAGAQLPMRTNREARWLLSSVRPR